MYGILMKKDFANIKCQMQKARNNFFEWKECNFVYILNNPKLS